MDLARPYELLRRADDASKIALSEHPGQSAERSLSGIVGDFDSTTPTSAGITIIRCLDGDQIRQSSRRHKRE